ncbi:MAG: hypothetical protein M3364_07645 [Actinomycetota bacterium]|nr:hypothetical protein [Actinomycetota bacterium]
MSRSTRDFPAAYATAFASYLGEAGEHALHIGYELGREAVELELNVLELARVHHDVLGAALRKSPAEDHERITHAAADFLAESLSAFEMVRRGYKEARERASLERRHAAIVRRLSALLADTSLALGAPGTLRETLQLVVEAGCELVHARCCIATVDGFNNRRALTAVSGVDCGDNGALVATLTALSGRDVGSIRVLGKEGGHFTEFDEAILEQLAQMTAAAIERARLYQYPRERGAPASAGPGS